jgi:hypothetical protein
VLSTTLSPMAIGSALSRISALHARVASRVPLHTTNLSQYAGNCAAPYAAALAAVYKATFTSGLKHK